MIKLYDRIEIAHEFANAINSDEIIRMILFGSVARGDDNDESDIDILIVVHHDNKELESFIDNLVVDFILKKEEVISPHVMTEEHFNKTKDYKLAAKKETINKRYYGFDDRHNLEGNVINNHTYYESVYSKKSNKIQ